MEAGSGYRGSRQSAPGVDDMEVGLSAAAALRHALSTGASDCFVQSSARKKMIDFLICQVGAASSRRVVYTDGPAVKNDTGSIIPIDGPLVPLHDFPTIAALALSCEGLGPMALNEAVDQLCYDLAVAKAAANRRELSVVEQLRSDLGVSRPAAVLIDGASSVADVLASRLAGARLIIVDRSRSGAAGRRAFSLLFENPAYRLIIEGGEGANDYAMFSLRNSDKDDPPIHFFTIVLNGDPFIRYHEEMLSQLDFRWHWHIVEGVAELVADTSWSVSTGGKIPDAFHCEGRSVDGTTEYLDDLKTRFPDSITLYRKPPGQTWNGKTEMVRAPLPNIQEPCLLWQVDADELWTPKQVSDVRRLFINDAAKTAAFFWCRVYVGPNKGISTRLNYAQNPSFEWLRVWNYEPGMYWEKHEPPVLAALDAETGQPFDVAWRNPFMHAETEAAGAVFDHFAYATQRQVAFKEDYYGYAGAVESWNRLQNVGTTSVHLRNYFPWVTDETMVDSIDRLAWRPLARQSSGGIWEFGPFAEPGSAGSLSRDVRIVVDGVFFQIANTGIARVWKGLLTEWVKSGFADNVVVLDRGGSAPRYDGIIYRTIAKHSWDTVDEDARLLQAVCDELCATIFVSTYYTTPTRTPSVFFGHDMIPEHIGQRLNDSWWRQKARAIDFAAGHIMVSHQSADDLCSYFPSVRRSDTLVAYNSPDPVFSPRGDDEVARFREAFGLDKPYVLLVGDRSGWYGYKNAIVVYVALSLIPHESRPFLLCVGGGTAMEPVDEVFLADSPYRCVVLTDDELALAYAGAQAYICPSLYEGFGLPITEAMSVGCPVIVANRSASPEIAGGAGLLFDPLDPTDLVAAIEAVSGLDFRSALIARGLKRAKAFDQMAAAQEIASYLSTVSRRTAEASAGQLGEVYEALATAERADRVVSGLRSENISLKRRLAAHLIAVHPAAETSVLGEDEPNRSEASEGFAINAARARIATLKNGDLK